MRQKSVLLRFIEAMNLINENHRRLTGCSHMLFRGFHCLPDFLHSGQNCRNRNERKIERICHQSGKCGLSDSGRPPQNHGVRMP